MRKKKEKKEKTDICYIKTLKIWNIAHIQYLFRTYSHLNNVDPDQDFNWVVARQSLKETTGGVSPGDGRVFNVIREGDLVDFQGSLKNINSSFMFW